MDTAIVHTLPKNLPEGTGPGVIVTFHCDECALFFQIPSLRTVGNIVTGTEHQTQMAIDAGLLKVLPHLLRHPKTSIQKEAAWVLSNVAAGSQQQIQLLIVYDLLPLLVALLKNVSGTPSIHNRTPSMVLC